MNTAKSGQYIVACLIVYGFLVGAAAGSFKHIVDFVNMLGVHGWQAWTAPLLIDGIALMGKLGRSHRFAAETQRAGLRLMAFGGILSLVANVGAGHNVGERCYGALLVAGFLLVEWYAGKLAPAPVVVAPAVSDELKAKRSAAAKKGAATRKRNAASKAREQRAARRPKTPATVAELLGAATGPAPTSPAPYGA